jgi:hypothetical protein
MAISLKTLQQNYQTMVYSDNDPTHEYFNMGLFNEYTPNNTLPLTLRFNQTKQVPIIDKANDYYISIIRWNVQSNLPVLIPDIQIKQNKEAFTNFTDYKLALMYDVETTTQLTDTFGLVSALGQNNLGIYKDGDFGFLKAIDINFPPDNSASIDYDNFNNGLGTNGNGSIYIISGGVIKVFDKVSKQVLLTLTPSIGLSHKFITTNKSTGDFYFGTVNNNNNTIFYNEAQRTGANTWNVSVSNYTSPSAKNNVAGIVFCDGSLYELSNIITPPDKLYGLVNSNMTDIEEDIQLTDAPNLISPMVYVNSGFFFATGSDNSTYAIQDPITGAPQNMNIVNNTSDLLNMYSKQANSGLYGLGTSYLYYVWNANQAPQNLPTNQWSIMGEFSVNGTQLGILSLDSNDTTNNVMIVGSDNNLYESTYPIAPYEFCCPSNTSAFTGNLIGFDFNGAESYIINSNLPFNNLTNLNGFFKHNNDYFVKLNTTSLNVYNGITGALLNTYLNLDSNLIGFIYLPITNNFVYGNNSSNIVIRSCTNPNTIVQTFSLPSGGGSIANKFCEIDSTHIAVCWIDNIQMNQILIYQYGNANPVNTINLNNTPIDITFNKNDITNGAGKLFYLGSSVPTGISLATELYSITFSNNTYTSANSPVLIYTEPAGRSATYIQCKPENGTICLLDCVFDPAGFWNDRQMNFFFQNANYNSTNIYQISYPFVNDNADDGGPYKPIMWMNNTTLSTHQFTQVTSNIELLSVSLSRSEPNVIYGLGQSDQRVYRGTLNNNSIVFDIFTQFEETFNAISSKPNPNGAELQNLIKKWTTTGSPSISEIIGESSTISTNPSPSSLYTDNTALYAVYSNIDNTTYINKLDTALFQLTINNLGNLTVLNGLIGYDSNNNILLSNVINDVNSLTSINPSTLVVVNNYVDPLTDYNTSSMLTYPFEFFETTSSYVQAGETIALLFIPETVNPNLEKVLDYPRNKEELFNNPYFYIKYVDTFCRMINNAIKDAFATITGGVWAHLPFFNWNSIDGKIVFNQPTSTPTGTLAPAGSEWYVSMNQPLYNLLNTFRFKYYPSNSGNSIYYPESLECRYLLDTNILFDGTVQAGGEYLTYIQQISSVQTWTPIQSWVFSSTVIPIESQLSGQPQNLNTIDPTTKSNAFQQNAITKNLTDFIVPLVSGVEATNQNVFYNVAGEYRLVDLLGNTSINQLTLEIKWRDKYGVDHDMYIDAGGSANLLCLLRKKSYNSQF